MATVSIQIPYILRGFEIFKVFTINQPNSLTFIRFSPHFMVRNYEELTKITTVSKSDFSLCC